jgi:hypothetical protein
VKGEVNSQLSKVKGEEGGLTAKESEGCAKGRRGGLIEVKGEWSMVNSQW